MARSAYRIKPYKHPWLKFVVRSKLSGKWERKFFRTKTEAQTYVRLKEVELLNQGKEGVTFPSSLRVMAQHGAEKLRPFGKTISDAVDFYLNHLEAIERSVPLRTAMKELIENRRLSGASKRYCYDLGLRIGRFCAAFPDQTVAEITTAQVDDWLSGLRLAPVTRNTFRRDLRTLFSFAATRRYCIENPVVQTTKAKEIDGDIQILTVDQAAKLLECAEANTLPFWAIGAFAGLRVSEIERLDWAQVDFESNLIEVKARHSKTAKRRLVAIQPNLHAWLAPYLNRRGSVCPQNLRKCIESDRERAELLEDWPPNALRHSFGSYHLAQFNDAAALSLQMGNSPTVIFKHYRELVKPKEAARYWQIKPAATGDKIVAMLR
jgi:site-specific recombinase XerD